MKKTVNLMLDSGAFSAWQRGKTIDVRDYMAFVCDLEKLFGPIISLDVIPPNEKARTRADLDYGAKASYKNHQKMRDVGLHPIPVFHHGEDWDYLEQYLKDGEPYIGISTFKNATATQHRQYLDEAFTILTNKDGSPIVKTHGFAMTNQPFFVRYPFTTVDSTTWSLGPAYGHILVPPLDTKGNFDWLARPLRYVASGYEQKNNSAQQKQIEDLANFKPREHEAIEKFLNEEVGIDITTARNHPDERRRAFMIYYMKMSAACLVKHFQYRAGSFKAPLPLHLDAPAIKDQEHLQVMFATSIKNKIWAALMTEIGADNRLLSYWELRDCSDKEIEHWVVHGTCLQGRVAKKGNDLRKHWRSEAYRNLRKMHLHRRLKRTDEASVNEAQKQLFDWSPTDES